MIGRAKTHPATGHDQPGTVADLYPSREGGRARMLKRRDPVVYATDTADAPISEKLVEQYRANGFLLLENVLSEAEIYRLQQEMSLLATQTKGRYAGQRVDEPEDTALRSVFAIHQTDTLFARLAADSRLAGLASYLLNDEVYIHQSRLNVKPAFRGKEFYWHSDFETWHVEDGMPRMRALSISVALTENHTHNGPLMLIPGSHRTYVACAGETPENHFVKSLRRQEYGTPPDDMLRKLVEDGGMEPIYARPGSLIVFDSNTMHGSNGNITPYPRSNAFYVYNAMSNRVGAPFCGREPRPEHVCSRDSIEPLDIINGTIGQ